MSKASKRERQRQNREDRRKRELQAQKRSGYFKTARNFGIVVAIFAVIFLGVQFFNNNNSGKKKSATTTSTTAAVTTSASSRPKGSPPLSIDPAATYTATIDTTEGTMVVALDAKDAKWGANNFITLARKGFYDGIDFERAAKNSVIQGGSAKKGTKTPSSFVSELPTNGYSLGDIAYAKTNAAPAGNADSTFFIITSDQALSSFNTKPYLYGDFGHLTSGLDVAQKIEALAPASGDGPPTKAVTINKITIDGPAPTTGGSAGTTTTTAAK